MAETVEKVYYDEGGFRVTSARFVAGNTTYPMSTINAVSKSTKPAQVAAAHLAFWGGWICGGIGLLSLIATGLRGEGAGCSWTLLVLGLVLVPMGASTRRKTNASYSVEVSTASGTTQAITSPDESAIDRIVEALNQAIVDRG